MADALWIPWIYLVSLSALAKVIASTMSALSSSYLGDTWKPNFSNTKLVKIATLTLEDTTLGAKNKPCNNVLLAPRDGPTSLPCPGTVRRSATKEISCLLPAT